MNIKELIQLINKCGHAISDKYIDAIRIDEVQETSLKEDAKLITAKAFFGENDENNMYVPMIRFTDTPEIAFMPNDWQGFWENRPLKPEEIDKPTWVDNDGTEAVILNGLPRRFIF